MNPKKMIGRLFRNLLPRRVYKLVANGAIVVPAYYSTIITDAERNFDRAAADTDEKCLLLMRKYAHIIDKGLHRRDAGPGHSKNYYHLLKECIIRLKSTQYANDPTVRWAEEKLRVYERLQNGEFFMPLSGEQPTGIIPLESFEALAHARRSNRDFSDKIVPNEIIDRLKDLANWASSSCNKQPINIYATNDPALASECLKCCKGGTGFSEHIPSFWVFTADILGYVWPTEIFLPSVDVCLGVQNVMLGATTAGLSGTLLSWAQKDDEEEHRLKSLLHISEHHQIIICAVIGYANTVFQTPARKNI